MTVPPFPAHLPEPILVLGAYGYRNVGDEAILAGLLRQLDSGVKVSVISRSPAETQAILGVRSVGISSALAELRRHRSLLIGGGGLFGRDMGALGRLVAPFGLTAAAMGRTVAIAGVGVESELPMTTIAALRLLARRAVSITVRDRHSQSLLSGWGIESALTEDLSEWMPPGTRKDARGILRAAGLESGRPIVGLCLTDVGQGSSGLLEKAVAELVDAFPEAQFCFIPMSQHPFVPAHNDLLLGIRLRAASPRIAVLDGQHHPADVLAIFPLLAAAVCMRFHALLFSARAGIPLVAIPYAEKCQTWLDEHEIAATAPRGPDLVAALRAALEGALAWSA